MSEKVKLPKSVCDALKELTHEGLGIGTIFIKFHTRELLEKYPQFYEGEIWDHHIMSALVLGYEPEMTPEEKLEHLFNHPDVTIRFDFLEAYRKGMVDTLDTLGINYRWMGDDIGED